MNQIKKAIDIKAKGKITAKVPRSIFGISDGFPGFNF